MADSTLVKICAACGTDCADKRRTKDTRGNYFCKGCFDDLLARKKRGERIVLRHAAAAAPPSSDVLAIEDDSPLTSLDLSASRSAPGLPPPPPVAVCPSCGAGLASGARLCVSCGARSDGGGALRTTVARTPRARGSSAGPTIFGILGILVGSLGVLIALVCFVAAAASLSTSALVAGVCLVVGLLYAWLGGLHLLGAIDTLRRNAIGPDRMRLSAGIYLGVIVVSTVAQAKLMSGDLKGEQSTSELVGQSIVGAVIACIWPIAVLAWTSRRSTREEIGSWR